MCSKYSCRCRLRRAGNSLLEVVLATMLLATALVPALRIMRASMSLGREVEMREALCTFCVSKLEDRLAHVSSQWSPGVASGNLGPEGYPQLAFRVECSDAVAAGGIPDRLMAVVATVWDDANGNGSRDAGESAVVLSSKVASLRSYMGGGNG